MTEKLPPFGVILVWGSKGSGKTWFGLSSPYKPILALDCENSSKAYKASGLFDFDRKECLDFETFRAAVKGVPEGKYGTILVDTAGQVGTWIEQYEFKRNAAKAETQSMLIWGEVRDTIRDLMIALMKKAPMIVLTAHSRIDYLAARRKEIKYQERVNGAFLELCDLSMQLVREPNQKVPYGVIGERNRIVQLPPKVVPATWEKVLEYCFTKPANWDELKPEEKAPPRLFFEVEELPEDLGM